MKIDYIFFYERESKYNGLLNVNNFILNSLLKIFIQIYKKA